MIKIQQDRCVGCGRCKKVCPMAVIAMDGGKAMVSNENCIDCGHCQSICPVGAVVLNGVAETVKPATQPVAYADLQALIESNRSIRIYNDTQVPRSTIEDILRTLDYTASAKNDQPVQWVVVSGKEAVEQVSALCTAKLPAEHPLHAYIQHVRNPITVGATHLLIAYAHKDFDKGHDDCVIKVTQATMLLHSQGIGACFLGFLDGFINGDPELQEHLGIETDHKVYSAIGFGYHGGEVYPNVTVRKQAPIRFIG